MKRHDGATLRRGSTESAGFSSPRKTAARLALAASLSVLSITLAACGGGGGGGGGGTPSGVGLLAQFGQPGSGETFGESEARHLLRRVAFAAPQAEVDRCVRDGLDRTVNRLLDAPPDLAAETASNALIEDPLTPSFSDLQRAWLTLMTTTASPTREKMALFWHQRLAVSGRALDSSNLHWDQEYRDLLRTQGLGNYRTLLKDLTKNGAMLVWLSGLGSTKEHPNENYGRELWELFTLGVDVVYTQQDIEESARALTGWDSRYNPVDDTQFLEFDPDAHDDGEKTILGEKGTWTEGDVVDITLRRPEAARYLAKRLLEGLCYDGPEADLVDAVAQAAVAGGWELKPLVRTIAKSRAFFDTRARKSKVADPVLHMVGLVRATEIPFEPWDLLWNSWQMGQTPLDPPSVKGWPQGLSWAGEQNLLYRTVMADGLAGKDHVHDENGDDAAPVTVGHLVPPPDAAGKITGAETVDHLARLLDVALSPAERAVLVDYMDKEPDNAGVPKPHPFDGKDPEAVEVKVRGLLSILAQHPDAMKN